ncbi:MAG: LicD family protein [Bacteroidaceae bacterium]|nr:LicD family protein [Bacteroidaceae bacterium]
METKHDMKAILGEDFFKEEVRCDYLITAEMKRVFAVLMDLYLTFAEICEKYNLRYYAIFGFLLGAIRHKGFIPWDDDLDVAMPREDYNKFMEIAPRELTFPYFVRSPYTDPNCFYSYIVILNETTSFIPKIFKNNSFKKGIPMDIFPLDYCNLDTYDDDRAQIYEHIMRCSTWMKRGTEGLSDRQMKNFERYNTDKPLEDWEAIQRIASNPKYFGGDYLATSVLTGFDKEKLIFPADAFNDSLSMPFETITVKVPSGYEKLLVKSYGDWKSYPPIEERGKRNESIIFDPDKSYLDYE